MNAFLLAVALVLAACGAPSATPESASQTLGATPPESPQSTPSTSPAASLAATPRPSASAVQPEPGFPSLASAVNGLRLREGPSVAADALVYSCTGIFVQVPDDCSAPIAIDAGRQMVVFDGPLAADGFDWYLVVLTGNQPGAAQLGWAATPLEGDPWLVPSQLDCPASAPDVDAIVAVGEAMSAYCYQGRDLTLEGWVVTGFGCGGMGTFEPTWLAHPCANMSYIRSTPTPSMGDQPIFLHYPAPGVTNPTLTYNDSQKVRLVGHYDDPAARGCVIEPDPNEPAFADRKVAASGPAADVAVCRMRFVVSEVTSLP